MNQSGFKTRYQDELEALRALFGEFAHCYPEHAAKLELFGADPALRRLQQGFSFLTARVKGAIEQSPQQLLTQLVAPFWPQALRPTPSLCLVQFRPQSGILFAPYVIPRQTLLFSQPIQQQVCAFSTTAPLVVHPIILHSVKVEGLGPKQTQLELVLDVFPVSRLSDDSSSPLRFQVLGPLRDALTLALRRHVKSIQLKAFVGPQLEKVVDRRLPPYTLRPLGMEDEASLLLHDSPQALAQRHLHEWLIFPEQYHAFGIFGLKRLASLQALRQLSLTLLLEVDPAKLEGVGLEHFALQCEPAINLFPHELRVGGTSRAEQLLRLEPATPGGLRIYSVDGVRGSRRAGLRYEPFMGRSLHTHDPESATRYFEVRVTPPLTETSSEAVTGPLGSPSREHAPTSEQTSARETDWEADPLYYFSLLEGTGEPFQAEGPLKVQLTCSNGGLTRLLASKDLCVPGAQFEAGVSFSGIGELTVPTPSELETGELRAGKWETSELWEVMQRFRHGWDGVQSLPALRQTLRYYARGIRRQASVQSRLDSVLACLRQLAVVQEVHVLGVPPSALAGWHLQLRVSAREDCSEGALELLGEALFRQLVALSPRGTCVRLSLQQPDGALLYGWPAVEGQRPLM